jgi:hypothetical protein
MSEATTVVYRMEARFNMAGQLLPYALHEVDATISPGMAARLRRYAERRLGDSGFFVDGWVCGVSATDGDRPRSEWVYAVEFTNPLGGAIGVQGILTGRGGHPVLDHGLCIEEGRADG